MQNRCLSIFHVFQWWLPSSPVRSLPSSRPGTPEAQDANLGDDQRHVAVVSMWGRWVIGVESKNPMKCRDSAGWCGVSQTCGIKSRTNRFFDLNGLLKNNIIYIYYIIKKNSIYILYKKYSVYIYYHKYAIYYIIYYIILCYIILYTSSYFIYYILYKLNNNIYILHTNYLCIIYYITLY